MRGPLKRFISLFMLFISGWAASAHDNAANYSQSLGTWVSGTHRGTINFSDWELDQSVSANSGHFIGSSIPGGSDIDTDAKSFGMYGHSTNQYAGAARRFAKPTWTTGDTFTFQIAVNNRNGSKGFNLRNAGATNVWTFLTGRISDVGGNYVNGANVGLGTYHANTIFTFTFVQHPRHLVWHIERSGGLTGSVSGTNSIVSGTIQDIRFYVSNTDNSLAANNLYFNNLVFTPAVRNNAPLTLGERRFPGFTPSYLLRFEDPVAASVTFRSSHDDWTTSYPLAKTGDVWEMDIRDAGLTPGFHTFKFRPNSNYESGSNRRIYIREDGLIAKPPAVYLTWTQDPDTTMVVRWLTSGPAHSGFRYRAAGETNWIDTPGVAVTNFPFSDRWIQHKELTGLQPATPYEFEVDGYDETYAFKTMPANLDEPLTVAFAGDILYGDVSDDMAVTIAALDPAFLMIGGDLSYSDGRAEHIWMDYLYFENWHSRFRAPDGRLIPLVVGLGNHEVRKAYITGYPYFEDTDAWRAREAPYLFRPYAFPGQPGYGVLDFGDYMSLIVLDTDHVNPIVGAQTDWLAARLEERRHVRHLFPVYHVPAYPGHRSSSDARNVSIRVNWLPLFENAGVHLAFEHHDHVFKRTTPLLGTNIHHDGIVFLGDGAWGVATRTPKETEGRWDLQVAEQRHHAFVITLTDSNRLIHAVDVNGVVFDEYSQGADGIPPAPVGLTAGTATSGSASLSWSPTPRAISYRVLRDNIEIGTSKTPHFLDTNRTPDTQADYVVHAVNRSGESTASAPITLSTPPVPPAPGVPAGVQAQALSPTSAHVDWMPLLHAYRYVVRRDGDILRDDIIDTAFTDTGLTPETTYAYSVQATNVTGSSATSGAVDVTTPAAWPSFVMDGIQDAPDYLLSQPAMRIYAAVRGTHLYVATWTPVGGNSDHFILVADELLPRATRRAPWNKKGFTALPEGKPYLGAESTSSDFIGWFDAPPSSLAIRSPTAGERIEGEIDLVAAFGHMPEIIYLTAAAYRTDSLNSLTSQGPLGNGDENIDPWEFLAIPVDAIRDNEGIGYYERLDPERSLAVATAEAEPGEPFSLRWRVVPGRAYHIWRSEDLTDDPAWTRITDTPVVAPSGADELTFADTGSTFMPHAFYSVEYVE